MEADVVDANGGNAGAHFHATGAPGELRVGSSFVRDGAIEWAILPLGLVIAPGRPAQFVPLALDRVEFRAVANCRAVASGRGGRRNAGDSY